MALRTFLSRLPLPELALLAATVVWGGSYAAIHLALQFCGPLFFVGARFLIAGLITAALFARQLRRVTGREILAGMVIGVAVCLGQVLQTVGLETITISQSAFLTALYVPTVPLLQWLVMRRPPRLQAWLGLACAFAGLLLLTGQGLKGWASFGDFTPGDTLTLLSAVAVAFEIVLISWFGQARKPLNIANVTAVQLLATGVYALGAMPVFHETVPAFNWGWAGPALGLGVASVGIQLAMNWAQRDISPTRATLIYACEPIWGGLFGRFLGERLPAHAFLGAVLIVAGVIISELKLKVPRSGARNRSGPKAG
ncbi:DMT family transporter [Oecophyllibacter saccharovorans]|uniref:DMT family transporter n=1 Tax=Oecophyllibacter saccharovorans TaxID=2558360 RepID=UPI001167F23C|nr:DMT family transporter [Oecophyllibacter saccharovorans]TPW35282.1 DMT family transporter [Oecophyllibacter saccharovorans]